MKTPAHPASPRPSDGIDFLPLTAWRQVIEALPGAAVLIDRSFRVRALNAMARESFQVADPAAAIGEACHRVLKGRSSPCEFCCVQKAFETGAATVCHSSPEEEARFGWPFRLHTTPLRNDRGEIVGALECRLDVSEFRQSEAEGRRHQEELAGHVAARTEELLQTNRRLATQVRERQAAEAAQRRSEEQLASILGCMRDAVFSLDPQGARLLHVNPAAADLYGRPLAALRERPAILWDSVHPEDRHLLAGFPQGLPADGEQELVYRLVRPGGDEVWVRHRAHRVPDDAGAPRRVDCVVSDITEPKRLSDELAASEERFRTLFEFAPDAYFMHNLKGVFLDGNRAAETLAGYAREELIGTSFLTADLLSPRQLIKAGVLLGRSALGKPTGPDEFTLRRRDGTEVTVEVSTLPVELRGERVILGIAHDIHDRKRTEEALRESKDRLQGVLGAIPDSISMIDEDFNVLWVNERTRRLLQADPRGRKCYEVYHGRAEPCPVCPAAEAFRTGGLQNQEVRVTAEDGQTRHFQVVANVASRHPDGRPRTVVEIGRDITDLKVAQEGLLRTEKLAAVGTLAGGVAHEFNNLHAGMLGFLELALRDPHLSERNRQRLERVLTATRRAASVTRNLLTFARGEASHRTPGDLNATVQETLGLLESAFRRDGVSVEHVPGEAGVVAFDRDQIGQVAMNLLLNAAHAVLGQEERRVVVETGREGTTAYLRVRDNGCGLDEEARHRVFMPFYTTKGEHASGDSPQARLRGTGLGLSVCQTIVESHGGRIEVESAPGRGSAFTVYLPAAATNVPAAAASPAPAPLPTGLRVLVLDDEEVVREMLRDMLVELGCSVACAADADEAAAALTGGGIDAMLLDVELPGGGGAEPLAARLGDPGGPALVGITGSGETTLPPASRPAEILVKPFSDSDLREAIQRALARRSTA